MSATTNPVADDTSDDDSVDWLDELAADFYIEDVEALQRFILNPRVYRLAAFVLNQVMHADFDYEPRDLTDFCGWHLARRQFLMGTYNRALVDASTPYCPSRRSEMHAVPITVLFKFMEKHRAEEGFASWGTPSQAWRAYYATFKVYLTRGDFAEKVPYSELPIVRDYLTEGSLAVEWTEERKKKLKNTVEAVVVYQEWLCGPEEYDVNETLRDTIGRSRGSIARELDNRVVEEIEE